MRRLGIDYGRQRVGVALTDERGDFAYPLVVLPNDARLLGRLKTICANEDVGEIILGESLNFRRQHNPLMRAALKFKTQLENSTGRPVIFEDETLTTKEANRLTDRAGLSDARAAAIILRQYLARTYRSVRAGRAHTNQNGIMDECG